jgi:hypothetical protein
MGEKLIMPQGVKFDEIEITSKVIGIDITDEKTLALLGAEAK